MTIIEKIDRIFEKAMDWCGAHPWFLLVVPFFLLFGIPVGCTIHSAVSPSTAAVGCKVIKTQCMLKTVDIDTGREVFVNGPCKICEIP